jgi:hypothetical protein
MIWNFALNAAGVRNALASLNTDFANMFSEMSSGISKNMSKFNAWQIALDYCVDAGKQMIKESRELIAISTKYDIPIKKMGELQMLAAKSGQSVGQLARGFRFLEMNMGRAALKPGGPQYQAMLELGITQEQIKASTGNTAMAYQLVNEQIMKIGDESRRNAFLQEIYGANWQNMLPIIEQNVTAQKDAASGAYEYSTSMTESLSGIADTMDEIAQDVKPIIMPVVQIVAMLATVLGALIEGLKFMAIVVGNVLLAAFKVLAAILAAALASVLKIVEGLAYVTGADGLKEWAKETSKIAEDTADELMTGAGKDLTGLGKHATKSGREISKSGDRLMRQTYAFGESIGLADEGAYIRDKNKALEETNQKLRVNKLRQDELNKAYVEARKLSTGSVEDKKKLAAMEEKLNDLMNEQQSLLDDKKTYKEELDRAGYKPKTGDDNFKPRTQEERKIAIQRDRQARERSIKEAMAQTPIGQQMETAFEVVKAYEEIKKLQEDLAMLEENNSASAQARADLEHQLGNAKITLMEKQRAHEAFMLKLQREREDSEKGRKDDMIKAMQEREQQFMMRKGMTGMDKQSVTVSNAIEQMQRDQAQLDKVMNDPKRTQQERLEAQKKFEGSTMGAMKEFDKLSLMQFQYSASDAAKKGMGGGIDVRENQLSVSKAQLDYLRKSYEIQLKQFGLSPDQFGDVPFQMQGPLRGGK